MTSLEFLFAPQNLPFAIALGLMGLIATLEGVGTLLGAGLSDMVDAMLPEFDADMDIDAGEVDAPGALSQVLGWLHVGKVPALMLLIVYLTGFGLLGYAAQYLLWGSVGALLPTWLVAGPAALAALPVVRVSGGIIAAVMPDDETSAVRVDSLIGRMATITLGHATAERSAEARVNDEHGTTHYVQVVPETGHGALPQGCQVLLVRRQGNRFVAIESTDELLMDES